MPKRRLLAPRGSEDLVIAEALLRARYRKQTHDAQPKGDPVRYVREVLGEDPWELQEELLLSIRDNPRTTLRKCHSSGGTRAAAQAVAWWLHEYEDGVVYTLAPTWPQVHDLLWKDLADIYGSSEVDLGGTFKWASCRWEFTPRRYAIGRSTDKPERLQGPHGGHFLLIIDEASGFPEDLEQAVEGMLASGETRLLLLSQPTKLSGMFFRSHHSERSLYKTMAVSAFDTPNLQVPEDADPPRPYLVRRQWVNERRQKWGEKSPLYQVRVDGKFPRQASDTLISLDWIENAFGRQPATDREGWSLGVDVARYGNDFTAFTLLRGRHVERQWRYQGRDLMKTAGEVMVVRNELADSEESLAIGVDDTGLGGGVTDRLREQGVDVLAINFGAGAEDESAEVDLDRRGSELWWHLREDLREGLVTIDPELDEREVLEEQLLQPVYQLTSTGKIKVLKLGLDGKDPSPDLADSLAIANEAARLAAYEFVSGIVEPEGREGGHVARGRMFGRSSSS